MFGCYQWITASYTAEKAAKRECNDFNKQETKMTREEAVKIAKKLGNDKPWYESDIELLEILGLLKFDEPKSSYDTRDLIFSSCRPCAYQAISQLEALGYKIEKVKPF